MPRQHEDTRQEKDALTVAVSPARAGAVSVTTPSKPSPPRTALKPRSTRSGGEPPAEAAPQAELAQQQAEDAAMVSSMLLLLQMRAAARSGHCALVLALADEHARTYPRRDILAREAERARCR